MRDPEALGDAGRHPEPALAAGDAAVAALPERETLFAHFQPLVRRLIRRYGVEEALREDLEAEIYCRFCELLAAYDPARRVPLRPYLARMLCVSVRTLVRREWRHRNRQQPLEVLDNRPSDDGTAGADAWEERIEIEDLLCRIRAAVAALPERQRRVVEGRYFESLSFDEIAAGLGVTPATARSLLRHAIARLRRQFAAHADAAADGAEVVPTPDAAPSRRGRRRGSPSGGQKDSR